MFWKRAPQLKPALIVFGLGNPGVEYAATRHNVGYWMLDELARRHGVEQRFHRYRGQAELCRIAGAQVALIKPTTYMNLSGQCAAGWQGACPGTPLVVVYDDISLPPGATRFRRKGSAGGHRGVQSIIESLRSDVFDRVKIGVGAPPDGLDAADYVLSRPRRDEEDLIAGAVQRAADAVEALAEGDAGRAGQILSSGE